MLRAALKKFPAADVPEFKIFKKLDTPVKIQDFLGTIPINLKPKGETCYSPLMTLRKKEAYCIEGAMLAAAALWYHGKPPLLLDLRTSRADVDHVVALFKEGNRWGAISKTNYPLLRYRDPVYKSVRELAMSYFNEYYIDDGRKTMRDYSAPFDLSRLDPKWLTAEKDLWYITGELESSRHFPVLGAKAARLRRADPIERKAGKMTEWQK